MGRSVGPYGPLINLRFVDDDDEDSEGPAQVILGQWELFGASHHVWFIRVHGGEGIGGEPDCQEAVCDPTGRFEAFSAGAEQGAPYESVTLPDLSGRWVMFIHPFET